MTDVLIINKVPGVPAGEIVPLTDRLRKHVKAGNAKVLPNAHQAWEDEPASEPPALGMHGTGTSGDVEVDDEDAATDEEE